MTRPAAAPGRRTGSVLRHGATAGAGFALVITPETAGWTFSGLRVLELAAGEGRAFATGEDEMVVVPLEGAATVTVDGERFALAGRAGVFAAVADVIYAPRDARVEIASERGGRFALPSARASRRREPVHVAAADVPVDLRGAGSASRQVNDLCGPGATFADRLIAVEVLTPAGNWSSYPPHKHDEDVPGVETALEEIYYYEVAASPAGRRGSPFSASTRRARTARSTSPPRCAPATRSRCRTGGTDRRWRRPATTCTTST